MLLAQQWGWSEDDGFSCISKAIVTQFAKSEKVQVSCLVAQISEDMQDQAKECGVDLFGAMLKKGVKPVDCLSFPPDSLNGVDAIVACGKSVRRHAPIIKAKYANSIWVHASFSCSGDEDEDEIQLCQSADLIFAIGSSGAEECEWRPHDKTVHVFVPTIIPSIFNYFPKCKQGDDEESIFRVIVFYPSVTELTRGEEIYSIPAKAVALLPTEQYRLISVCAPHDKTTDLKPILVNQHGMSAELLKLQRYSRVISSHQEWFSKADLLILPFLPSKLEDFGLIALQAISADLPVLVSHKSGLGKALTQLPHGNLYVVNSDRPRAWRKRITAVKSRERNLRLSDAKELHKVYKKRYSRRKQCEILLDKILEVCSRKVNFYQNFSLGEGVGGKGAWDYLEP